MMYLLVKGFRFKCLIKFFLLCSISLYGACSQIPKSSQDHHMAATIYTELAQYYWQNGYQSMARDRLMLALQQDPTYAKALLLQEQWQ